MRVRGTCLMVAAALGACLWAAGGCGVLGLGCGDESGRVQTVSGSVTAAGVSEHSVGSPKSSNLLITLSWPDPGAQLELRATITDCGGHVGCEMVSNETSPLHPGCSGIPCNCAGGTCRQLLVDGWKGKQYRIEVLGDPNRSQSYELTVDYSLVCEG